MIIINQNTVGDLNIQDEVLYNGNHTGNIYVNRGGNIALDGNCSGIIVIEEGGIATIHGKVDGYIFNIGGRLNIESESTISKGAYHIFGLSSGNIQS